MKNVPHILFRCLVKHCRWSFSWKKIYLTISKFSTVKVIRQNIIIKACIQWSLRDEIQPLKLITASWRRYIDWKSDCVVKILLETSRFAVPLTTFLTTYHIPHHILHTSLHTTYLTTYYIPRHILQSSLHTTYLTTYYKPHHILQTSLHTK